MVGRRWSKMAVCLCCPKYLSISFCSETFFHIQRKSQGLLLDFQLMSLDEKAYTLYLLLLHLDCNVSKSIRFTSIAQPSKQILRKVQVYSSTLKRILGSVSTFNEMPYLHCQFWASTGQKVREGQSMPVFCPG